MADWCFGHTLWWCVHYLSERPFCLRIFPFFGAQCKKSWNWLFFLASYQFVEKWIHRPSILTSRRPPPFFLPQWSASRLRGQMSTPSQKWNIDNAFCNDLNHGVVMVQLRIRCASTLKRKKRGLRQTSLNQGKWPNLSFVIRRKEGGVSYVIHSLNLHNGARNILRWISHLSYLFKEWESSWEEKNLHTCNWSSCGQ